MRQFLSATWAVFQGGHGPRHLAMAVALGLVAGHTTGWNLTFALVLLAVLLLNVPLRLFTFAWCVGCGIAWTLGPLEQSLGRWLLESSLVGALLARAQESWWMVLFDFDRYSLLGGLICAALLAIPAALATAWLGTAWRRRALAMQDDFELGLPQRGWSHRLGQLLLGKQPLAAMAESSPMFRRRGLTMCGSSVVCGVASLWMALPMVVENSLLELLSSANQATVDVQGVRLSLLDGTLEIDHLQVTDPEHLDRNRLEVDFLSAKMQPMAILRGRLQVDSLLLEGVTTQSRRTARGKLCGHPVVHADQFGADSDSLAATLGESEQFSPGHGSSDSATNGARASSAELSEMLADWETVSHRLNTAQQLLTMLESVAQAEPTADETKLFGLRRKELLATHTDFNHPQPRAYLELMVVKGLSPEIGLGTQGLIELTQVSSAPQQTGRPMRLTLLAPEHEMEIAAQFNFHRPGQPHELRFRMADRKLTGLMPAHLERADMELRRGTLSLAGQGTLDARRLHLAMRLELRDFTVRMAGEQPMAGLTPELWNQGLSQLPLFRTEAVLQGPWQSPIVTWNNAALVASYQAQLQSHGHQFLVQSIEEQMAQTAQLQSRQSPGSSAPTASPAELATTDTAQENPAKPSGGDRYANVNTNTGSRYANAAVGDRYSNVNSGDRYANVNSGDPYATAGTGDRYAPTSTPETTDTGTARVQNLRSQMAAAGSGAVSATGSARASGTVATDSASSTTAPINTPAAPAETGDAALERQMQEMATRLAAEGNSDASEAASPSHPQRETEAAAQSLLNPAPELVGALPPHLSANAGSPSATTSTGGTDPTSTTAAPYAANSSADPQAAFGAPTISGRPQPVTTPSGLQYAPELAPRTTSATQAGAGSESAMAADAVPAAPPAGRYAPYLDDAAISAAAATAAATASTNNVASPAYAVPANTETTGMSPAVAASSSAPPPAAIGLEMGYEELKPMSPRPAVVAVGGNSAMQRHSLPSATETLPRSGTESAPTDPLAEAVAGTAADFSGNPSESSVVQDEEPSRWRRFTQGTARTVKGWWPWGKNESVDNADEAGNVAETPKPRPSYRNYVNSKSKQAANRTGTANAAGAAPSEAPAVGDAATDDATTAGDDAKPWYKRFWK